jgi:hypothetical protein
MDSISVIIIVIVFLIVIFGVLVWIIIAKTKNRRYVAFGEVAFNNNTGGTYKDSKKLKRDAAKLSDYIKGDVTVTQLSRFSGELTFKHIGKDIKIITDEAVYNAYPTIVVDGISYYKYSKKIDPTERANTLYKEYVKNNGEGFVTESEYKILKEKGIKEILEALEQSKIPTLDNLPFIIIIINGETNHEDGFIITQYKNIGDIISDYISRHRDYHFTNFAYSTKDLLYHKDKSAKDIGLYAESRIHAVGFRKIYDQKQMIKYIKSITVKRTPHKYDISKNKIIVTPDSGSITEFIKWHYENIGSKWDWTYISNNVFNGNKYTRMYVSEHIEKAGYNIIIFYDERYLQLFANCLKVCGLVGYTPNRLLSIVEVFFNESDPEYYIKMTIINVLFGDYTGEGYINGALEEENRDPIVMKSYELYQSTDPNVLL